MATTSGSPSAPCICLPCPWPPRSARKCARRRNDCRSRRESSQRRITSPPRPPSPPSGPPLGTWASRRNESEPLPPAPARTSRWALSVSTRVMSPKASATKERLAWQAKSLIPMPQVFLITGASTGIGAATARQAAEAGYKVVLAARSEDKLKALADELGGLAVPTDVTEYDQLEALVAKAQEAYGRIDVVFANAGVGFPRGFTEGDPDEAKDVVVTNVYGIYATIRATAEALKQTKGHLVITSSIAGRRALKGSLYSATKFAVTGMAEAARQDFNGTGVRT